MRPSIDPAALGLSTRDASILAAMLHKLDGCGGGFDFDDAARALHESVMELIPAGRIYLLGATDRGPIVGSIISGVGITPGVHGIGLVRVHPDGQTISLGSLRR